MKIAARQTKLLSGKIDITISFVPSQFYNYNLTVLLFWNY